jgi:U3 small nucleolar RNA-associated protein 14
MGDLSMRDSGGKEKDYALQSASLPESIHKKKHGMATLIRDEEGNIVSIEEPEKLPTETAWGPALNDDDEEFESDSEDEDEEAKEPPKKDVTQSEHFTESLTLRS